MIHKDPKSYIQNIIFNAKFLLVLIALLFLFTRLLKISEIPPSLYWDEASIIYNAHSFAVTGADEWGKRFPIHFRAFGEFKLPVYIYSTVPFAYVFGSQEWVVRLPSVLYSFGMLIVVYFLGWKITNQKLGGLLAAFILTVSPWFYLLSRTGYEASAGLFFYSLALLLILNINKHPLLLLASIASFILSMYSYNSYRILAPLTLFGVIAANLRSINIKKFILPFVLGIIIFFVSMIPIIRLFIFDAGFARSQSFSLFPAIQQVYDLEGKPHLQITYNRGEGVRLSENLKLLAANFISHLSPDFLLLSGDKNPRSHPSGAGQIYLFEIVFLLAAIFFAFKQKNRKILLILMLFLLSLLPASLFKESPHALRSLSAVLFLSILCSFAIVELKKRSPKLHVISVSIVLYILFFTYFFGNFLSTYNQKYSQEWQYGYKQIFTSNKNLFNGYDKIVISDHYGQPYIFALRYMQIDPLKFRRTVTYNPVDKWGFSTVRSFENFVFGVKDLPEGKLLIFVSPQETMEKVDKIQKIGEIRNLDQSVAFVIYERR